MFILFWVPIILIGLTLFIFSQLDNGSGKFTLPVWAFFMLLLYFIPIFNLVVIFPFVVYVLLDDNCIKLKKDSIFWKFREKYLKKLSKMLKKEVSL